MMDASGGSKRAFGTRTWPPRDRRDPVRRQALKAALESACEAELSFGFDPASPRVLLHEPTYRFEEVWEAVDSLLSTRVTMGAKVREFEKAFAEKFGYRHAVMVNSGSSANLLMVAALTNAVTQGHLLNGDEVIVPALCWSTSVWPLIQHGLVPVIVDIDRETLDVDPGELARAVGPRTRAVLTVPIYGNPCAMDDVMRIVREKDLLLMEDCCESLGATFGGRPVGTFGRTGTFSFYFSHHITTLEGGMVVTSEDDLADTMRILRAHGWVRDTLDPDGHAAKHPGVHPKFLFTNLGYNLRPTEISGGFGLVQLRRFDDFVKIRSDNARYFSERLAGRRDVLHVQKVTPGGESSWFGCPMTVEPEAPFSRDELCAFLESKGIETRVLNAGNIARQPALAHHRHRVVGDLAVSDYVLERGFTFGNHQEVDARARAYIGDCLDEFLRVRGVVERGR
jgi:CDP-6-deoxy-D-xylo-4-hexulose-3-dehydrase